MIRHKGYRVRVAFENDFDAMTLVLAPPRRSSPEHQGNKRPPPVSGAHRPAVTERGQRGGRRHVPQDGMNLDYVATDWGTVAQRFASHEPPEEGGWSMYPNYV